MNDSVVEVLKKLIANHGIVLCTNWSRLEGLLCDHAGQHRREINILVMAAKRGIAEELLRVGSQVDPLLLNRLVQRLHEETGIAEKFAEWAVNSWRIALGKDVRGIADGVAKVEPPPSAIVACPALDQEATDEASPQPRKILESFRWHIANSVSFERGEVVVHGSAPIFIRTSEGLRRREGAERAIRSAILLGNALSVLPYEELTDPSPRQKTRVSFAELVESFLRLRRQADSTEQRKIVARRIRVKYKQYLERIYRTMSRREFPLNPFPPEEFFEREVFDILQQLKPPFNEDKFQTLLNLYQTSPSFQRLPPQMKRSSINNISSTFHRDIGALPDFLGYAQIGIRFLADLMDHYNC
jgi:hypothetical protein